MKRSNRLVILVGVLLAVLAFVAIVILLNNTGGGGGDGPDATPETATVLVTTEDIEIGEAVTPDKAEPQPVDPEAVIGTALTSTTQLQGQPALRDVPAGSQLSAEVIGVGSEDICIACMLNPGEKAVAFQVDAVTGLNFLVTPGDAMDIVMSQTITVLQETADSAANPDENAPQRFEPVTGLEEQRTVKTILQNKRVLFVSANRAQAPEPVEDTNGDGVINDDDAPPAAAAIESVIIIFAGTDQDAEVIKFAQNALGEQGSLTAVVRHADDEEPEVTTGITIDLLVSEYGLRLPEIVEQLNEEATETP